MGAAAGWYQDPDDPRGVRWWDGTAWTEHRQVLEPAPPVSPMPPVSPSSSDDPSVAFGSHRGAAPAAPDRRGPWPSSLRMAVALVALVGMVAAGWYVTSLYDEMRSGVYDARGGGAADGAGPGPGTVYRDADGRFAIRILPEWTVLDESRDRVVWEVAPPSGTLRQTLSITSVDIGMSDTVDSFLDLTPATFSKEFGIPGANLLGSSLVVGADGRKLVRLRFDSVQTVDGTPVPVGQVMWIHLGDTKAVVVTAVADPAQLDRIAPFLEPLATSARSLE